MNRLLCRLAVPGLALLLAAGCAVSGPEPAFRRPPAAEGKWERVREAEKTRPSFHSGGIRGLESRTNAEWLALAASLEHAPLTRRLAEVNAFFNRWPYREDKDVYGVAEYWATPAEFAVSSGDCEDYAIAKYYALRHLGVPAARLRVATVWNRTRGEAHAVLVAYGDEAEVFILDNFSDRVRPRDAYPQYDLLLYVNEEAEWARKP